MANNLKKSNPSSRWQDESLVREESEVNGQESEPIDNPEHMESPDSMANPQSTRDVGRKVGEESGSGPEGTDRKGSSNPVRSSENVPQKSSDK
jgi:hypothetical protein